MPEPLSRRGYATCDMCDPLADHHTPGGEPCNCDQMRGLAVDRLTNLWGWLGPDAANVIVDALGDLLTAVPEPQEPPA